MEMRLITAVRAGACMTRATSANVIINGSFEQSSLPASNSFDEPLPGSTVIIGWTLTGNNLDRAVAPYPHGGGRHRQPRPDRQQRSRREGEPGDREDGGAGLHVALGGVGECSRPANVSAHYAVVLDFVDTPFVHTVGALFNLPGE